MDNLNNIPNVGNWGDAASKLNDNFNKVKQAVTTVENTSKNNKGYFSSLSALNTAFPSPKAGQTAYVYDEASSTNYYIYNAVNGAWVSSTVEAPAVGVDISGYTKTGGSTKTTKEVEDEIVQLAGGSTKTLKEVDDEVVQLAEYKAEKNEILGYDYLIAKPKNYWNNTPKESYEVDRGGILVGNTNDLNLRKTYIVNDDKTYTVSVPFLFRTTTAFIVDFYFNSGLGRAGRIYVNSNGILHMDPGATVLTDNNIVLSANKLYVINIVLKLTQLELYINDQLAKVFELTAMRRAQFTNRPLLDFFTNTTSESATGTALVSNEEFLAIPEYYTNPIPFQNRTIVEELKIADASPVEYSIEEPTKEFELACNIIADPDWDGYEGNLTCRLLDIVNKGFDSKLYGFCIGSGNTGSINVQSMINNVRTTLQTTEVNVKSLKSIKVSITNTGFYLKVNDEEYTFPADYTSRLMYGRSNIIINSVYGATNNYYFKGVFSDLRVGNNLSSKASEGPINSVGLINSEYIQRILTERAVTLNDEVFRFPFAASGDKIEMGCNLIPDPSWNGNNNNYTCDLLRFTDKPYDAVGTNGIRVRSSNSGDIFIQSIIDGNGTTVHSTNIKSNIPLAIKVVFEGDDCSLFINGEVFELSGNYIGIISRHGGEVTFNPYSGSSGGYFYKGELLNLRMGVNLYVDNNPNPVVIEDTNRFIVKPDFINNIPGSRRFHPTYVSDYSTLTSNGKTYIAKNAGAARCAVFNIKEKGKKKIYLPLSVTGDKSYLLDAVHLKPTNGASIEKEEKGYMAMDQYIHPAIAYSSIALNGYNYFIFASNYPRENARYEDDDLLVSVDGLTWKRVLPYGEAGAGEPQLPENVFLSGTDYGREKTFVPIPPAGTTFEMNGTNFTPGGTLKHDPEILIEGGYLHLYNFYNFYESDGGSGRDTSKYHRFVVVFRTNNLIDWEICRTDGSVISATSSNILEIFTQSSVDGKNNYIRYFNWIDNPNLGDSNMQVVKDENSGVWYAYYKDYGDYTISNLGIKRYTGTSHLNFNWDTSVYCQSSKVSRTQEHEDIFFYNGKYYYITADYIHESDDGINFTELPELPIPTLTAGRGYKTDVCIGANGNVLVANGCLPITYNRPRAGYPYPSGGEVATIIFKLSSFQDILDFAKNGKDFASLSVHISIFPKTGLAKSFNIPVVTPNTDWIYKELLEYEFEGGEDIGITILAYSCSDNASVYYSDIIIE